MCHFRVSVRAFKERDRIEGSNNWRKILVERKEEKKIKIEDILEKVRLSNFPDCPSREMHLRVFNSKRQAINYWAITPNSKLYEVSVDGNALFEGDYNIIHEMFQYLENEEKLIELASNYWSKKHSDNYIAEVVVPYAIVKRIISDREDERVWTLLSTRGQDVTNAKARIITEES